MGRHARKLTLEEVARMRYLRLTTSLDELAQRFRVGRKLVIETCRGIRGPKGGRRRLPTAKVEAMKADRREGLLLKEIAAKYGCSIDLAARATSAKGYRCSDS